MPLLAITISRPCSCFGKNRLTIGSQIGLHNKNLIGNERGLWLASTFSLKMLCFTEKMGKHYTLLRKLAWRDRLMINAIATLEITSLSKKNEGVKGYQNVLRMDLDSDWSNPSNSKMESSNDDSTEVDEREKLRRMRISKANKGNTPWNKGRKHSPETLQRIKERTRLAMQDPKVKMKLISLGHAQSEETRIKIGLGVRLGWERRREKLMVQEACHHEWQNLIALAAKRGLSGEEELQWDSYRILNEELEKEWLENVEQRKNTRRIKWSKRAPKSAEQKRKIAEAIAAKWADPVYRNRVSSGLAKYHAIPEGVERRSRRKPSNDGLPRKRGPKKKDKMGALAKHETKSPTERIRPKRSKAPSFKDPLASSKLEMLKNIRAQRAASVDKKSVAIARARLLIVEAEKAAQALEIAAKKNPLAEASLIESRMLIAEANQIIKSIEGQETISFRNNNNLSENSTASGPTFEIEADPNARDPINDEHVKLNGVKSKFESLCSNDFVLPNLVKGKASKSFPRNIDESDENQLLRMTSSNGYISLQSKDLGGSKAVRNGISVDGLECKSQNLEAPEKQIKVTKKWVRGRLVEEEEC